MKIIRLVVLLCIAILCVILLLIAKDINVDIDAQSVIEGLTINSKSNKYIVLIGDSMLNNYNYVQNSIPERLKIKTNNVLNVANDNSIINDCYAQLDKIPDNLNTSNTYVFISAGGNDILTTIEQLDKPGITAIFNKYITFIKKIKTKFPKVKLNVLNLYLPTSPQFKLYENTINIWNNLIQTHSKNIYNVIETNKLLIQETDFAFDIEPSDTGGEKIANAIYLTFQKG